MTFVPGIEKVLGSGRKPGTPNRQTELVRAGLKSAIRTCREGGMDPISIMMEASRFLHSVAAAFTPRDGEDMMAAIRGTPKSELEFIRKFLVDASMIAYKAAEFGYPKLQRIDQVGDAPTLAAEQNKFEFVLNIERPDAARRREEVPVLITGEPATNEEPSPADAEAHGPAGCNGGGDPAATTTAAPTSDDVLDPGA